MIPPVTETSEPFSDEINFHNQFLELRNSQKSGNFGQKRTY